MYKKGDVLSITFRNGYDANGKPIMMTLERAEVLNYADGLLQITYRDLDERHDGVEIDRIVFNIKTSDDLMKRCETG
jgi:hypothetical protein